MKSKAFIGSLLAAATLAFGTAAEAQTEVPVPAELDAVRRARAVLRRARQGLLQARKGSTSRSRKAAARPPWRSSSPTSSSPVAYVDAATMMRGVGAGMPIKAVGVTLQQSPMAFIYRADAARPTKISEIKGSRIAITAGDASLAIFTAFMGKLGMKVEDVQMITVANPAAKEQAVLNKQADALLGYFMDQGPRMQLQTGVKMGWTRLYDMAGVTTLSSAIIANNDWLKDAKNQDTLRRFLRASQRGWQYSFDNRAEAAEIFRKAAPVFTQEIALLEVDGTMTIIRTERTKGKPIAWSDAGDWKDSQELLEKFAKLKPQPDVNVYYTNSYLSEAPYLPKK